MPGFPTTSVLDTFTDGVAHVLSAHDANWALAFADTGGELQTDGSGLCKSTAAAGTYSADYRIPVNANDTEIYVDLQTVPGANDVDLYVRLQNPTNSSTYNAYGLTIVPTAAWTIYKYVAHIQTSIGSVTQTITSGDGIGLRVIGNQLEVWYRPGAAGTWTLKTTITDNAITGVGSIAFETSATATRYDNIGGGAVGAGSSPPVRIPNRRVGPMALRQRFRQPQIRQANPATSGAVQDLGTITVNGVATVSGTVVKTAVIAATVNGVSTVTATVVKTAVLNPAVSGKATVTATVVKTAVLAPSIAGKSTVTATLVKTAVLRPSISGTATVTATLVKTAVLAPTVNGVTTVTATVVATKTFTVAINGVATVTATVTNSSAPVDTGQHNPPYAVSIYYHR